MRIPSLAPHHVQKVQKLHRAVRPHKKSLFIALNGVVLMVLAGSTAAYAELSNNVQVTLDGHTSTVRTFGDSVASTLATDGITLGPDDRVTVGGKKAGANTPVADGDAVSITFAKPVTVAVDGHAEKATVHEKTVGQVLKRLGVKPTAEAYVSAAKSEPLSRTGNKIVVSNPKNITVEADGKSQTLTSTAPTVGEALEAAHVTLDADDQVQPAHGDLLSDGDAIKVTRIEQVDKTEVVPVQPVEYKDDSTMEKGTDKVLVEGKPGRAREHVLVTVADGKERSRLVLNSQQLSKPETKVVARGTAEAPAVPDDSVWDKIAACESGGNWHINTGNGYYGGLQFSAATWKSLGAPGLPSEASREVQIKYAKILQARSGWGQWGCAGARNN